MAAEYYGRLVQLFPEYEDYRLYYSQALYQACRYEEAMKETSQIDSAEYGGRVGAARPAALVMLGSLASDASYGCF